MDNVIVKDKGTDIFSFFWWGLIVFNAGDLIKDFSGDKSMISTLLIALGGLAAMVVLLKNISIRSINYKKEVCGIYFLLILWMTGMYLRSDLSYLLGIGGYLYTYSVISYSLFLILLIPISILLKSFISVVYKINILFFFLFFLPLLTWNNGFKQILLETFAAGAGFIYITNKYHSSKQNIIALVVLIIAFLIATLAARRNLMMTFGLYIFIGSITLLINGKIKSAESKLIAVLSGLVLLLGAFYFYLQESSGAFSKITNRAMDNTREEVFLAYAVDMGNPRDLLVGRGMFGTYYCPGVDEVALGVYNDDRGNVECGYLQWILKGGFIYLSLYLCLFGIAIYKGLRSSNQLARGCAFILIVQLLDMITFGFHAFNTKSFMIWMAVAVCLNEHIRAMKDSDVLALLFKRKMELLPWKRKSK